MKIYNKDIQLNTDKNIKNCNILCFSDLHYSKKLGKELLLKLYNCILNCKPDYICFLGDLINDDSYKDVFEFFNSISQIAPILVIEGNHDLESYAENDHQIKNKNPYWLKGFSDILETIPNIYVLKRNATKHFDSISFTGTDFYHHSHEINNIDFLNRNIPDISPEDYNILLSHSPYIICKKIFESVNSTYEDFDIALTGHIHNALMPPYIDNKIKKNIGIYTKDTGLFPSEFLGEKDISLYSGKTITRINVPPIRTFNPENALFNNLNKFYPPSIRTLKIRKKN